MITKKREGDAWRIYAGKRRTALSILKGEAPRYREPQEYDLYLDPNHFVLTANSVGGLMNTLETLAAELKDPPE